MVRDGAITKTVKKTITALIEHRSKELGLYFRESTETYSIYSTGTLLASKTLSTQDALHSSTTLEEVLTYLSGYEQCVKDHDIKLSEPDDNPNETVFQDKPFRADPAEDAKLEKTWEKEDGEFSDDEVKDINQGVLEHAVGKEKLKELDEEGKKRAEEVESMRNKSIEKTAIEKVK